MRGQGRLHLRRADAVPGDEQHVVGPALNPEVAVLVAPGHVAGAVPAGKAFPVQAAVAFVVVVHPAGHGGPRALQHQQAAASRRHGAAVLVHHLGLDAGQRPGDRAGLQQRHGQGAEHDHAGFRLPPGVQHRAAAAPHVAVEPQPRLRADGFAHRAQQAQGGQVVPGHVLRAVAHQHTHQGWRGVQDGHAQPFHHGPHPPRLGVQGVPFVQHRGGARHERPVHHVAVPGDPAGFGRAPEDVRGLYVEHPAHGAVHPHHVAAVGVHVALGLARGAGCVQQEQRVGAVHDLGERLVMLAAHRVVVPYVAPLGHGRFHVGAVHHHHVAHPGGQVRRQGAHRLVGDGLQRDDPAVAVEAVDGDDDGRAGVLHAVAQRAGGKAAEHRGMHRADLGGGQHGEHRFRQGRHVDDHPVALAHAQAAQRVGQAVHLTVQLVVGEAARIARFAFPDQGQAVLDAGLDVPVQRVVHDVAARAGEPAVEGGVAAVVHRVPAAEPFQFFRRLFPVAVRVGGGAGAGAGHVLRVDHGPGHHLRQGAEHAFLAQQGGAEHAFLAQQGVDGAAGEGQVAHGGRGVGRGARRCGRRCGMFAARHG